MLRHVSALSVDHLQGARNFFLVCAAYAATYVVGILLIIIIIVVVVVVVEGTAVAQWLRCCATNR